MDAVLDAATELIADRGQDAVTVRAIAARAGINHALVHRYFGSKDELIAAVIEREADYFRQLTEAGGDVVAVVDRILKAMSERRAYVRFLTRAILDGRPMDQLGPPLLVFREILSVIEADRAGTTEGLADTRLMVAALGAMALGWRVFGGFLASGVGLEAMPREQMDARVDRFITSSIVAPPTELLPERGSA